MNFPEYHLAPAPVRWFLSLEIAGVTLLGLSTFVESPLALTTSIVGGTGATLAGILLWFATAWRYEA